MNFGLGCSFVFFTFVLINVIYIPYQELVEQLGFTFDTFNTAVALAFTGLATSSVLLLPLLHKFGRRWLYLVGSVLQFVAAIWLSQMRSKGDLMGAYFLSGMGGGLSETLLQVTIVDLFFVHQRGTMSGFFLLANTGGSGLGPLIGGYIVTGQGWRWMWRWCAIFLGVNLLLVLFFFEETKYIPSLIGRPPREEVQETPSQQQRRPKEEAGHDPTAAVSNAHPGRPAIDPTIKRKPIGERFALITNTDTPVKDHLYQPFRILFTFPAVAYTAITYGALNAWYTVLVTVVESSIVYPPYNFSPSGVGLLIFSVTVGCTLGSLIGGPLNDKSVLWLSGRNGGIYEPETRLYLAVIAAIPALGGIFMAGLGLHYVGLPSSIASLTNCSLFRLTHFPGTTLATHCDRVRRLRI
jgi:MFS family permease